MEFLVDKINHLANLLLHSEFYYIRFPLFVLILGFLETVGVFGFFIPMEIVSVSYFAFIHNHLYLFLFATLVFSLGIFGGLIVGYFIGKKYYSKLINKIETKFPATKEYFCKIDEYMDKYHFWMFPILINIGYARPIMALHLGGRNYSFKKYLIGAFIATIFYVIPRVVIGYLIGIFGKIVLQYLKIGYKYIIVLVFVFVVIYFIYDIFKESKELKDK